LLGVDGAEAVPGGGYPDTDLNTERTPLGGCRSTGLEGSWEDCQLSFSEEEEEET
jgi:hypothetical protein